MPGYLISGLPAGKGGAGRFVSRLADQAALAGWKVLCRPARSKGKPVLQVFRLLVFYLRLWTIHGSTVVVVHPQSLRWRTFFNLILLNRLGLFIVDNSFFCIRSYNYRGNDWSECLDCLGDVDRCHESCSPFPVFYSRRKNLEYLHRLSRLAGKIRFFAQNRSQVGLLRKHFGQGIEILEVGMATDEFDAVPEPGEKSKGFDVVFHGALIQAKGAAYAVALAGHLPELKFLIPGRVDEIAQMVGKEGIPENVTIMDITWESGLKEAVEACRMVLCPSLWSAPIEGALVKSIIHNGRVAVYSNKYGYTADLPEELLVRLDADLMKSAELVREALRKIVDHGLVEEYLRQLREKTDLGAVFRWKND